MYKTDYYSVHIRVIT